MGLLSNLSTEYSFGAKSIKSSCKLKNSDSGTSLKLKHGAPGNKLGFEAEGKLWEVSYDLKTKDALLQRKWKLERGEFKVKQRIPGGNCALIPSPTLQWKSHLVNKSSFKWQVEPSYCMQGRYAALEQKLEFGKKTKLEVDYTHKKGVRPSVSLSVKPGSKWAKQVGLKGTSLQDARLTLESEPSKKFEIKGSIGRQVVNDVRFTAHVRPGKLVGVKPKLTLETRHSLKSKFVPQNVIAGLSLDM